MPVGPTTLQAARQRVLSHFPRFSPLFLRLDIQVIPGVRTAFVTEDLRVGIGEVNLTEKVAYVAGWLMHEMCHPLFDHFRRMGKRDPHLWNIATDIAINEMLRRLFEEVGQGKFELYPKLLFAETFGLSFGGPRSTSVIPKAEDIYAMLEQKGVKPDQLGEACGSGMGNPSDHEGKLVPRADPKTYEQVQIAVEQTMNEIRTAGSPYGGRKAGYGSDEFSMWKGMKPRPSVIRWQDEFAAIVGMDIASARGRNWQENWRIPNRRGAMDDFIMPGQETTIPDVAVLVDSSGSTSGDGAIIFGEVAEILTALGPTRVLTCDTVVKSDVVCSTVEEFMAAAVGGGGTDMTPGLVAAGDGVIVCITDGGLFGVPRFDRLDDVIWVIIQRGGVLPWMQKVVLAYGNRTTE